MPDSKTAMADAAEAVESWIDSAHPSLYDHDRVAAFISCCIDMAEAGGINLLEATKAFQCLYLAFAKSLAESASELGSGRSGGPAS